LKDKIFDDAFNLIFEFKIRKIVNKLFQLFMNINKHKIFLIKIKKNSKIKQIKMALFPIVILIFLFSQAALNTAYEHCEELKPNYGEN
jgi:hypothetical protein